MWLLLKSSLKTIFLRLLFLLSLSSVLSNTARTQDVVANTINSNLTLPQLVDLLRLNDKKSTNNYSFSESKYQIVVKKLEASEKIIPVLSKRLETLESESITVKDLLAKEKEYSMSSKQNYELALADQGKEINSLKWQRFLLAAGVVALTATTLYFGFSHF